MNKYSTSFSSVTSVTVAHNLGTTAVVVACWDALGNQLIPQSVTTIGPKTLTLTFAASQTGTVVVIG